MGRLGLNIAAICTILAVSHASTPARPRQPKSLINKRGGFEIRLKKPPAPPLLKKAVSPPPPPPPEPVKTITQKVDDVVDDKAKLNGILTVLGGSLTHLTLGTLYCWGNFVSYVPKHLLNFDGSARTTSPDAGIVFPLTIVGQMMGLPLGPILQRKVGEQKSLLLGCWLMAAGVYLSSYAPNLSLFILFYSFFFGIGVGIAYTAPIVAGWKWFPNSKGLVSGAVLAGFGGGGFLFNLLGSKLVNPGNERPVLGAFPSSITNKFNPMLRKLALIYFTISLVGALLVRTPASQASPQKAKQVAKKELGIDYTVKEALQSKIFWIIWSMIFLISTGSLSTVGVNKAFGQSNAILRSDSYLALVAALGALFNGAGRLFWGSLSDRCGFKNAFLYMAGLQTLTLTIFDQAARSRYTFAASVMSVFFTLGGAFAMFPAAIQKTFGASHGVTIYSYTFSAFALASILGNQLAKYLYSAFGGYSPVFRCFAAVTAGSLGLGALLQDKKSSA